MRSWTFLVLLAVAPSFARAQDLPKPNHALVIGFDRLFAKAKGYNALGGRILLGELNCTSCHKADAGVETSLLKKQAPILDGIGGRVRPSYLRTFLDNPQLAKPDTAMPDVLGALSGDKRQASVENLVHFLASTGTFVDVSASPKAIAKGKKLYHQIGCVVCHGEPATETTNGQRTGPTSAATVLPLGDLSKKYSIISLTNFLHDPHKTRPSGRMPSLNLNSAEATAITHYLLANLAVAGGGNVNYTYYELAEEPSRLPDFAKLTPTASGVASGFDLGFAQRLNNVAMKFDGLLRVPKAGQYTVYLSSDDGSKLWIDKRLLIDNDGIHSLTTTAKSLSLPQGQTPITVGAFNAGGGYELEVDIEGPGMSRQPLSNFLLVSKEAASPSKKQLEETFTVDPAKASNGRILFASLGCASCHDLKDRNANIQSTLKAPELAKLKPGAGCLAASKSTAPRFCLNDGQRNALAAAIKNDSRLPKPSRLRKSDGDAKDAIVQTFATFNCYACHQRDGIGGVELGLNDFFTSTQKEMGDEGRLPPHLNGVGGKLTAAYLKNVLANGAKDRPYMLTRMPKFGAGSVGDLQAALEAADPVPPAPMPTFKVNDKKIKSAGRYMVGNNAFGCIKCHNFREFVSGGVRGINMTIMADRLRREWFTQYLLDPNKYRPGTRMPAVWPLGQSQLPKILDGDTAEQIEAVWRYLADGTKAALPFGVGRDPLPLIPQDTALIYRNFIQGAGPRAIAVGYPEKINLAFDANDLRYALLWHKEFIDASRHWNGRGEGFQAPLGESVLQLAVGPTIAVLEKKDAAWPTKALHDKGYQFRGYRLDDKLRPTFLYGLGGVHVEDFMLPVSTKDGEHFQRTVTITADKVPDNLWFRAVSGSQVKESGDGWFAVGNDLKVRLERGADAVVRSSGGQMELLVPIRNKQMRIVQELVW